jgi:hypothetical protein
VLPTAAAAALVCLIRWRWGRTSSKTGVLHHPQPDRICDARLLRRLVPAIRHGSVMKNLYLLIG